MTSVPLWLVGTEPPDLAKACVCGGVSQGLTLPWVPCGNRGCSETVFSVVCASVRGPFSLLASPAEPAKSALVYIPPSDTLVRLVFPTFGVLFPAAWLPELKLLC